MKDTEMNTDKAKEYLKSKILGEALEKNRVGGFIDGDRIYKSCYYAMESYLQQRIKEIMPSEEKCEIESFAYQHSQEVERAMSEEAGELTKMKPEWKIFMDGIDWLKQQILSNLNEE